jgi:sulfane dehydrogenase subunit SoxC
MRRLRKIAAKIFSGLELIFKSTYVKNTREECGMKLLTIRQPKMVSEVEETRTDSGRRRFLTLGAAMTGGALLGGRAANAADAFPPQDAPWSQMLGPGVVDQPYGKPSEFVKDVIRRNVPWLTGTQESSVSFTPLQDQTGIITANGLFFERYHGGRATVDPAQHKLMIHGLVDRPLLLSMEDITGWSVAPSGPA